MTAQLELNHDQIYQAVSKDARIEGLTLTPDQVSNLVDTILQEMKRQYFVGRKAS